MLVSSTRRVFAGAYVGTKYSWSICFCVCSECTAWAPSQGLNLQWRKIKQMPRCKELKVHLCPLTAAFKSQGSTIQTYFYNRINHKIYDFLCNSRFHTLHLICNAWKQFCGWFSKFISFDSIVLNSHAWLCLTRGGGYESQVLNFLPGHKAISMFFRVYDGFLLLYSEIYVAKPALKRGYCSCFTVCTIPHVAPIVALHDMQLNLLNFLTLVF